MRHPEEWQFFCEMNKILVSMRYPQAPNHGGNIRGQGADTRYSGNNGITGQLVTLTPRQAAQKYMTIRAVVHFKKTDWHSGGVPSCCRFASTPLITTRTFVDTSHSQSTLIDGENCVIVNTPRQAAEAVMRLTHDDAYVKKLSLGMEQSHKRIFESQSYWDAWERMLNNLV
jgi:hypothetical protein